MPVMNPRIGTNEDRANKRIKINISYGRPAWGAVFRKKYTENIYMAELKDIYLKWNLVFEENFTDYEPGHFSDDYTALEEFYYPSERVFKGPWQEISSYHLWGESHNPLHPNWEISESSDGQVLEQKLDNRLNRKNWKYPIKKLFFPSRLPKLLAIPAMAAGEHAWQDYCFEADVRPMGTEDIAGVLFRIRDGHCYYLFGLQRGRAWFIRRKRNELNTICSRKFDYKPDAWYKLSVVVIGKRFTGYIDGQIVLDDQDTEFTQGKIGLASNVPAYYRKARVFTNSLVKGDMTERVVTPLPSGGGGTDNQYPGMTLWKRIRFENLHSGRTIRVGDVTGDGRPNLIFAQGKPMAPGNDYNALSCLSVLDLDGTILWSSGERTQEKMCLSSDLPFQIYDIDNDGRNEIICARNFHIEILDGATGEVKRRIPTPEAVAPFNGFKNILGDSIYICNLTGTPRPRDILIKDRYSKIWAYNHDLDPLWEYKSEREMGHFPYAIDVNGDGRDEVLVGYSLLDADGRKQWELPLSDHADAVTIFRHPETGQLMVVIAASDEGLIFADIHGKISKHLRIGHMQTVTLGRLIPGSKEYQIATNTFWGSPGIIYIVDLDGNIIKSFQPSLFGSLLEPVNWLGNGEELLLLSAATDKTGGFYDGLGNQVVAFPDDGHPKLCYGAHDIDGDGWDELLCWDHAGMWIYRREGSEDGPPKYRPCRYPPIFNDSNYRSNISLDRVI